MRGGSINSALQFVNGELSPRRALDPAAPAAQGVEIYGDFFIKTFGRSRALIVLLLALAEQRDGACDHESKGRDRARWSCSSHKTQHRSFNQTLSTYS